MSDIEDSTVATIQAGEGRSPSSVTESKPKRKYTRKPKIQPNLIQEQTSGPPVQEPVHEPVQELTSGQIQKDKKPRTEKQKEAFQRMLQAKKDKHNELLDLREIEKGQAKIDQLEEKIVAKKKKVLKESVTQHQPTPPHQPSQQPHQSIRQVSTARPIVFM